MAIRGFFGEFAFLGNYYPSAVGMDGILGPTVEHVFQSMKAMSVDDRLSIASKDSPDEAKKAGRAIQLRKDWEQVRLPIMASLVREKFTRHQELRKKLLDTGEEYLEETNHWDDTFWGVCEGIGANHLGSILMELRTEIRETGKSWDENRLFLECSLQKGHIRMRRGELFDMVPFPLEPNLDFSKIEGMMLGLAVGDSLGNTSESALPAARRNRHGEIRDYLPNSYAEGRPVGLPSDDTQLSFWTLESMLEDGRFVPENVAKKFASGRRIFGLGSSVRKFLRNYNVYGKPWNLSAPESAGNGALMRIAPMLIPYLKKPCSDLWVDTALSSMITHNDSGSIAACVAFINMFWQLLAMKKSPDPMWWPTEYIRVASMLESEDGYQPRGGHFTDFKGPIWRFVNEHVFDAYRQGLSTFDACLSWYSGAFLLETVPSVIYILMKHGHDFEEAIVRAVNDTKDNDTIAAIVGAAAGALHSRSAIPDRWLKNLLGRTTEEDDGRVFELLQEARLRWWDDGE